MTRSVAIRGIVVALAWRSFPEIGQAIGGRDHSTIIHAIERHEEQREARAA